MPEAEVTMCGLVDMQVCVPSNWTDEQVIRFANVNNPSGTINGWSIIRHGSKFLDGDPERQPCKDREDFVHIRLEC